MRGITYVPCWCGCDGVVPKLSHVRDFKGSGCELGRRSVLVVEGSVNQYVHMGWEDDEP